MEEDRLARNLMATLWAGLFLSGVFALATCGFIVLMLTYAMLLLYGDIGASDVFAAPTTVACAALSGVPLAIAILTTMNGRVPEWRLVAVSLALTVGVLLGLGFAMATGSEILSYLFVTTRTLTVAMAAGLLVLRTAGLVLRRSPAEAEAQPDVSKNGEITKLPPRVQFSLLRMFSFTAAFAVLLSNNRTIMFTMERSLPELLPAVTLDLARLSALSCYGLVAPALLWVVFANRPLKERFVVYVLAGSLLAASPLGISSSYSWTKAVGTFIGCQLGIAFPIAMLSTVRMDGYRLMRNT